MEPEEIKRYRRQRTVVVLVSLLGVAAFVLFVMVVAGWSPLPMVIVLGAFIVVGALHYLIWGRTPEQTARPADPRSALYDRDRPWTGGGAAP